MSIPMFDGDAAACACDPAMLVEQFTQVGDQVPRVVLETKSPSLHTSYTPKSLQIMFLSNYQSIFPNY